MMNVLWIMADQLQAGCLGFMGHPQARTPHLDAMAAGGVVFDNCFSQSPVCMAARACLFTGRYPASVKMRGMGVLPPQETTTTEWLKRRGYATALFGKLHFTPEVHTRDVLKSEVPVIDWRRFADAARLPAIADDPFKQNYGFDVHTSVDDAGKGVWREWLKEQGVALPTPEPLSPEIRDLYVSPCDAAHHHTSFIAGAAEAYIRQRHQKPWFSLCSFVAPHHPFEAPASVLQRYPLEDIVLPDLKGGVDADAIPPPASRAIGEFSRLSEETQRRVVRHYLASISLIDDNVGRLVAALKETGQADNTVVIFTADHGEFCGSRGLLRKPSLHYDELIRVPLVMRVPGMENARRRIRGMVEQVDLHPTLFGLLGLDVNPGVQGIDWSAPLREGRAIGRDSVYSEMHDMPAGPYMAIRTLRTEDWKLSVYPGASHDHGQFFHLKEDPGETRNLYRDPAFRDAREQMLWRLLARMHADVDPLPLMLSQW